MQVSSQNTVRGVCQAAMFDSYPLTAEQDPCFALSKPISLLDSFPRPFLMTLFVSHNQSARIYLDQSRRLSRRSNKQQDGQAMSKILFHPNKQAKVDFSTKV